MADRQPGDSCPRGPLGMPVVEVAQLAVPAYAKLAVVVSAAGGHHTAMVGSPGTGRPLLAAAVHRLLPDLSAGQARRVGQVAALRAGVPVSAGRRPPWQAPHHTASLAAILGGRGQGGGLLPGAVSLASDGVMFLDEVAEFPSRILHAIAHALNRRQVVLANAGTVTSFPARFQLVTASDPCPAAHVHPGQRCTCAPLAARRYRRRADLLTVGCELRIDLDQLGPGAEPYGLVERPDAELAARVLAARRRAVRRWRGHGWRTNADATAEALTACPLALPTAVTAPLDSSYRAGSISGAGVAAVLRIGWTLADLAGRRRPHRTDLAWALLLHHRP